ncbi:FAD-dependent oxidoreductase [Terriglobus aquaticus]|uniref:FAD-dependent oxidoreductase n=1 Tax=Terriglobus aquaticus TaxID=940139 RepID=A0ABW9KHW6_9BACT|nr:FAD-binding oxidoreductase [Terriglobus aquaticus]
MAILVPRTDPRFPVASRSRNSRFPSSQAHVAGRVAYCADAEDVARALQQTIDAGLRPTVRSSGHCYEDFVVNNPNGTILDVSALDRIGSGAGGAAPYTLGTGTQLGRAYEGLFKLGNVCIPGGTCYTVTAGGHISGGGYGTLARMYGLTVDWVTAIDVVTVDAQGKAVPRRVSKTQDPDLFRALRGGQGSNFGIITAFHFDRLPPMPEQSVHGSVTWDWNEMTEDKFVRILRAYGAWMERTSPQKEARGIFAGLYMTSKATGRMQMRAELTTETGPVKDVSVLLDLLDQFGPCKPLSAKPESSKPVVDTNTPAFRMGPPPGDSVCYGERPVVRTPWIDSTLLNQSGNSVVLGDSHRAKYKSCYMTSNFSEEEAQAYYRELSRDTNRGLVVAVDSYGGAVNNPQRAEDTAIPQRSSVMKLQYQSYWQTPEDDAPRLAAIRDTYNAVYSVSDIPERYKGTPFGCSRYEGCYINYPDADMLQHAHWTELYYGKTYPFLQAVKRTYDPHNIFHNAMSVQV